MGENEECNLEKNFIPERYQEIYCSNKQTKQKTFVCKNGYTNGNKDIVVQPTNNNGATACITTANECKPIPIKIPQIIRPVKAKADNYECTLDNVTRTAKNIP